MTQATIKGSIYTDDGTYKNMNAGGHRQHFLPLVTDIVSVAQDVADDAADVAADKITVAASVSTASGYASTASTAATNASSSASAASTSATAAASSATTASGHATTASGHASTAATQATNASNSATAAASSATSASNSATAAASSATSASSSATAAAASAATAVAAPGTSATSTTSLAVGEGSKSLTIQTGKSLVVGMPVVIARTAAPATTYMVGIVTAYTSGTGALVVEVSSSLGSGTYTDWTVSLTGPQGALSGVSAFMLTVLDDADAAAARTTLGAQASDATLTAFAAVTFAADTYLYATAADTFATGTVTSFARTLLDDADAATARTTLGLAIGTSVQAYDAELAALAGLVSAADRLPYFTGSGSASLATFTTFGRSLVDDADASAARTTLGLVIGTNVQAWDADLDTWAGKTAPSGTVVGTSDSQTLTSKTLTNPTVTNYTETVYAPSAGTAFTVDLTNGSLQNFTTSNNVTITLPAPAAGKSVLIAISYGGTHTVTWAVTGGSSIRWAGGSAPTATSVNAKRDKYSFVCIDGTSWEGGDAGRNA